MFTYATKIDRLMVLIYNLCISAHIKLSHKVLLLMRKVKQTSALKPQVIYSIDNLESRAIWAELIKFLLPKCHCCDGNNNTNLERNYYCYTILFLLMEMKN